MNRNVQLLALGACVVASLAVAWWATSGGELPRASPEPEDVGRLAPHAEPTGGSMLDSQEPAPTVGSAEFPAPDGKDRHVVAEPSGSPRLVSGTVRDGDGNPVAGALVYVTTHAARDQAPGPGAVLAASSSDAEGRFEIRATVQAFQLFASARKEGFLDSKAKEFTRGAEGLLLDLGKSGLVSGRLLLDPWVRTDRILFEITVSPEERRKSGSGLWYAGNRPVEGNSSGKGPDSDLFKIEADGRFVVDGFATATVSVTVHPVDDPAQVLEIRDVLVQRAGAAPDARIDPIDLRGRFQRIAVDVIDDAGLKRDGARVALREAGRTDGERSQFTRNGCVEFLAWSGPREIDVALEGFRTVRLPAIEGDQVVQLRSGIRVQVTLRGRAARPAPPDRLAVAFMKGTQTHPVLDGMGAFQDPFRTTFVVGSPGPHEIGWYVERGQIQAYLDTGTIQSVDVRDQEAIQEFVIDLPSSVETAWTDRLKLMEQRDAEVREREGALQRKIEEGIRPKESDSGRERAPDPK